MNRMLRSWSHVPERDTDAVPLVLQPKELPTKKREAHPYMEGVQFPLQTLRHHQLVGHSPQFGHPGIRCFGRCTLACHRGPLLVLDHLGSRALAFGVHDFQQRHEAVFAPYRLG